MKTPAAPPRPAAADPLQRLAEAYGVATTYEDWARRPVPVAADTVRTVLGLLGVDAADPADALTARDHRSSERGLPPTIVVDNGGAADPIPVTLADGAELVAVVELEDVGQQQVQ